MTRTPNKITAANAGGPRRLPTRAPWAARIAEFCRCIASTMKAVYSSGDSVQVGLRRSVLEAANITCYVQSDPGTFDFQHADSSFSLLTTQLCVRDADYDDAVRLLADSKQEHS